MSTTILLVDDDPVLSELVSYILKAEGYNAVVANDGEDGLRKFQSSNPDLVVLDVTMPEMDGFEVCQRIRRTSSVPVIMLTAQGAEDSIVKGLDMGADDYVTKPFQLKPFMARVRANLRRANAPQPQFGKVTYTDDFLTVDLEAHKVTVNGEPVKLTPTEYKLLAVLVKNRGRILEFRTLLEQVWGFEYIDDIDYLRVYIWHLRRKIEPDPKNPVYLHNELSLGYRFDPA
ncbi:MAG: response regulator transcription factor [Caldilinea sp.]|nr:response regulator transcription factor [Caldilinea sp.]